MLLKSILKDFLLKKSKNNIHFFSKTPFPACVKTEIHKRPLCAFHVYCSKKSLEDEYHTIIQSLGLMSGYNSVPIDLQNEGSPSVGSN